MLIIWLICEHVIVCSDVQTRTLFCWCGSVARWRRTLYMRVVAVNLCDRSKITRNSDQALFILIPRTGCFWYTVSA